MSTELFNEHFTDSYFLQSVINSIEEGVVVQNNASAVVGYNRKALDILCINEDQLFGRKSYNSKWYATDKDGISMPEKDHPIAKTIETGEPQLNVIMGITVDENPTKWINVNTRLIQLGDDQFAFAAFSDITGITNANDSLTHEKKQRNLSEKKFENVFKYSNIGKAILTTKNEIIDVNDSLCTMLGYNREEIIGSNVSAYCDPDDFYDGITKSKQLLTGEIKRLDLEMNFIKKNGELVFTTITNSIVKDENGNPQFIISQIQEATELKQVNRNLEIRNSQLHKTQLALEKKVTQLKEFAGIITHDVRGPAHNIRKMLEMYETTEDPELKQASMDYLKKVSADLTNNLNELIQILQIHMEKDIPVSDCSFKEVIDIVCLQLQDIINEKQAKIVIDLAIPNLTYPRVFLQSIIYNLLSNSLKYTIAGQVPVIEIKTFTQTGATCLSVKDNGLGIDLARYKDMLFKFQKSFHSGFESKGIGLYLIKNQIEEQGGTISAVSEPNKGIIFTVRF